MNQIRILKSFYVVLLFALVACQTQAISPTLTSIPSTPIKAVPTLASTPKPLDELVIAEWRLNLPVDIAFGFDSVWFTSHRDPKNTVRIDPSTNQQIAVIENTGYRAHSVLVAGDFVWVDGEFDDMAKIDPKTNTIVARVTGGHTALAYAFDSIWSPTRKDELDRIDPASAKIIATIKLGDGYVDCNNGVLVTVSAVWVDHCDEAELIKIDPVTNTIVSKILYTKLIDQAKAQTKAPTGKASDFLWISWFPQDIQDAGLLRLDPNTGAGITFLPIGHDVGAIAITDDAIWVGSYDTGHLSRVNVATNQIDATYKLQPNITKVAIGFGSIWVIYEPVGLVQRLDIAP